VALTYPDDTARRLAELCGTSLRAPASIATDGATGTPVLTFDPPLSAQEQTTYDGLLATARSAVAITPDERTALEPHLATLRTFQQMSRADFLALTNAARERQTFDVMTAQLRVIRALLRD